MAQAPGKKKAAKPASDAKAPMTAVTWEHPYGSAFFESIALLYDVSQRNAQLDWLKTNVSRQLKQTNDNVIMVVLERGG